MRKALQILIAATGATIVIVALVHMVLGASCVPGGSIGNATTDSEDRYFATYFLAYGSALLWCVPDIERKTRALELLALPFFVAGVTRLVSMAAMGLPHPLFIALTPLELVLPLVWWGLARRLARTANGRF